MRFYSLLFFLTFCNYLNAQKFADKKNYLIDSLDLSIVTNQDRQLIDSCINIFHNTLSDTSKVAAISRIVEESWDENVWVKYNKWLYFYIKSSLSKTKDKKSPEHISLKKSYAAVLNNEGYYLKTQGKLSLALSYYYESLRVEQELEHQEGISMTLNNIGALYHSQGETEKALDVYHQSLMIEEQQNNKAGVSLVLNNLAAVLYAQGDTTEALNNYKKSLTIETEINNKEGISLCLNNIGHIYNKQGNYAKAIEYLKKGLKIYEEANYKMGIAISLNNLGENYLLTANKIVAKEYFEIGRAHV